MKMILKAVLMLFLITVLCKESNSQQKPSNLPKDKQPVVLKKDKNNRLQKYISPSFQQKPKQLSSKKLQTGKQPVTVKYENNNFSQTPVINYSQQELDIMQQMDQMKQSGNSANDGDKILELQKKLETLNGATVTREEPNQIGTLIPASNFNSQETDNITTSTVINYANNYIFGVAAQVEQRGPTAGKIWLAVALANGDTGVLARPDTIAIYYSTTNGATYNLYAKIAFSGHNRNDIDNIDMEIIENTSGTKYLYIVFGYITNAGYGQRLIGYDIVSAPTLGFSGSTLSFPGFSSGNQYLRARITSDNARFPSNPYVTIVVTEDSLAGSNHYFLSKICRVLSPFTLSPSFTYLSQSMYAPISGYDLNVTTDVANYHNGSDSLIYVLSSYPGFKQYIYLYKAYSISTIYPAYRGSISPSNDDIEYARVATNGGTNQKKIMISYSDNYLNTGDFDEWVASAPDASNWSVMNLDYTSNNRSRYGDVIGRRNADGSFVVTFKNIFGNLENVSSYGFSNFSLSHHIHALNTGYANSIANPKPLFKYVSGDSCLNIWSYYYKMFSARGCSASNLYLTIALEGYYDSTTDNHSQDQGTYVMLANASPPYNIVDTGYAVLDYQLLTNVFTFPRALTGNYYVVIKHYNTLETWSASTVYVNPNTYSFYDFTSSSSQAYGDNMVLKGSRWCVYSGDVNQDGTIDVTDILTIYNDALNFVLGQYLITDLNGDNFVDFTDILIAYNNSINFVNVIKP